MNLLAMTLEGKRSSSLRRGKQQRRTYRTSCFSRPAVVWAVLVVTFIVIRGPHLPTHHSRNVNQWVFPNGTASSVGGSSRKWTPTHREIHGEESKREFGKRSESEHHPPDGNRDDPRKLYNHLKSSSTPGFSLITRDGTDGSSSAGSGLLSSSEKALWEPALDSEETLDASKAEVMEEEDEDGIRLLGTVRVEEDQDQDQVEEEFSGVDSTSQAMIDTTAEGSWVAHGLKQKVPKPCAEVEEMGSAAAGDTRLASLRLRRAIRSYFTEYGAERVRQLPPHLFCQRSFVLGKAQEDGFGNNMYKLLTAAGLGMILNRSLIIAENGATKAAYIGNNNGPLRFPFGDYIAYSDQAFSMKEIKRLWADHDCSGRYNRALVLKLELFDSPAHSTALCEDWTKWAHPIVWFKDTQDTVALQFLLKNQHPNIRSVAALVLGDPSRPDSRPNTFGELMMAVVEPKPEVREAVNWALRQGGDSNHIQYTDIALHLRMRNSASREGPGAASACILRILSQLPVIAHKRPRIVVVSDTPSVVAFVKRSSLARSADIITFDYSAFLSSSSRSSEFSLRADAFLPPSKRKKDWGPLPRWVAVVDFFLAARAKHAVVSAAHRRVGTTFAQLVASLAAAYTLEEVEGGAEQQQQQPARLFSSFQESLLIQGLTSQGGWGHSWRPFNGKLSCRNQPSQCAITPLLPYAWWDAPWQSPSNRDTAKMKRWGIFVESNGSVTEKSVQHFCRHRKKSPADSILLALPRS